MDDTIGELCRVQLSGSYMLKCNITNNYQICLQINKQVAKIAEVKLLKR